MVSCRDLNDEAVEGTNINAAREARSPRGEHVAGSMGVGKDQHPAVAYQGCASREVSCALVSLATSGGSFDYDQPRV